MPSPDVLSSEVGGETVVLNSATGSYYGLDEVATRAWQLIGQGQSLDETHHTMAAEFDVAADVLERDLDVLVSRLVELGLLIPVQTEP